MWNRRDIYTEWFHFLFQKQSLICMFQVQQNVLHIVIKEPRVIIQQQYVTFHTRSSLQRTYKQSTTGETGEWQIKGGSNRRYTQERHSTNLLRLCLILQRESPLQIHPVWLGRNFLCWPEERNGASYHGGWYCYCGNTEGPRESAWSNDWKRTVKEHEECLSAKTTFGNGTYLETASL